MEKELEALERIGNNLEHHYPENIKDFKILQQALQRLEAIENANPSQAMGCLHWLGKHRIEFSEFLAPIKDTSEYNIIKQALLKAQEQEKVLEIIKEKNLFEPTHKYVVDFSKNYTTYCKLFKTYKLDEVNILTEEEFELLKRYFNE